MRVKYANNTLRERIYLRAHSNYVRREQKRGERIMNMPGHERDHKKQHQYEGAVRFPIWDNPVRDIL